MTKSIQQIRTYYPENDPDIADVIQNATWDLAYGWQNSLNLTENILANKDIALNKWWAELPIDIKESLNLFSVQPNVFFSDQFVDDYYSLEEKPEERELNEFEQGYERQQGRLKSNVIKLKDYKPDETKK